MEIIKTKISDVLILEPKVFGDDPKNSLFLSIASVWEMQIKLQAGRLSLRLPLSRLIDEQIPNAGLEILPIEPQHIYELWNLLPIHWDPFDRIMIAQAIVEGLSFVSKDSVLAGYSIQYVWWDAIKILQLHPWETNTGA